MPRASATAATRRWLPSPRSVLRTVGAMGHNGRMADADEQLDAIAAELYALPPAEFEEWTRRRQAPRHCRWSLRHP